MPRRRRRKKDRVNWIPIGLFGGVFTFLGAAIGIIGQGYSIYSQVAQRSWVEQEIEKVQKDTDSKISVSESNIRSYSNNNRAEFTRESDMKFAEIRQNIAVMQEQMARMFEVVGRNKTWIDVQRHTKER